MIMVAIFGGFALGEFAMVQQLGFGLGVAILVDVTLIRVILVPASMKLLGDKNWYFPKFLEWLPDLRVKVSEFKAPNSDAGGAVPAPATATVADDGGD